MREAPLEVLAPEERERLDQYLSSPLNYPQEFKQWLTDYLATNIPPIPVSQLLGYKGTLAHNEIVNTEGAWDAGDGAERTWIEAPDGLGPEVTGLADGEYFVAFGCKTGRGATGGATTRIGASVDGADPSVYATFQANDPDAMIWRATLVTARNGTDNNTIAMNYWYDLGGGATAQFLHRWLTVLRVT